MRSRTLFFFMAFLFPSAVLALPNINSEDAFLFDFQGDTDGSLLNGSIDAYDGCYYLTVNGAQFRAAGAHVLTHGGRGWDSALTRMGDFEVRRSAWVPVAGGNWARYIDTFRNTAAAARNLTVSYSGNLGSDGGTITHTTYDGDASVEAVDYWAVTDDADGGGDPSLGHVIAGDGGIIRNSTFSLAGDNISWAFPAMNVGAGETVAIMFFAIQEQNRANATAACREVVDLGGVSIDEADDRIDYVQNFPVATGRPRVSIGGPYVIPEGGELFLDPRIEDPDGDPLRWSWDLDGDGGFDDSVELHPLFDAHDIDGEAEAEIALYVVEEIDGGEEITRNGTITIANVAPNVISDPPAVARRGGEYRYVPVVTDPAPADTWTLALEEDEFPMGMVVVDDAVVWEPSPADIGGPHPVLLVVEDDDGGEFFQAWGITVLDNTPPVGPSPLYPTIDSCVRLLQPTMKVSNGSDADDDPLTYHFQVDSDAGFRSMDLQSSPEEGIPEGIGGFTEWRVPRPLVDRRMYYWRAWVSDGVEESDRLTNVFQTCAGGADSDADVDVDVDVDVDSDVDADAGDDGPTHVSPGCACRAGGSAGTPLFLLSPLALVALFGFRRRHR